MRRPACLRAAGPGPPPSRRGVDRPAKSTSTCATAPPACRPRWRCTWCWTTAPPTSPATPAGGSLTTPAFTPTTPQPRLVAEPGGAVLLDPGPSAAQARRVHLGGGSGGQGDGVHRRLQPHRHAVPVDL